MKIILAPDSFKGSLSAKEMCQAMTKGIKRVNSQIQISEFPLADGGEGTLENLVYATEGTKHEVEVLDPLRRKMNAFYGVLGDKETVIIEMAQASGLPLLKIEERNPLVATSYGTGQLISAALDKGFRKFIIGLGGSATNDGGAGMLRALGVKLYGSDGEELLVDRIEELKNLATFDLSALDKRIEEAEFLIASDVNNPLCGPLGASAIFGPQKGADKSMIKTLDETLHHFASIIHKRTGVDVLELTGAGAAGGMGAALIAFLDAEVKSGIEITMEYMGLPSEIQDANLIVTGEGKLDQQTLGGKVISGVCKLAKDSDIPVIAICGSTNLSGKQLDELGLIAAFSIVPGPCTLDEAIENTIDWTADRMEQITRTLSISLK